MLSAGGAKLVRAVAAGKKVAVMKTSQKKSVYAARGLAFAVVAGASLVTFPAMPSAQADEPRKERGEERRDAPPAEHGREKGEERARESAPRDGERRKEEARREGEGRPAAEPGKEREARREGEVRRDGEPRPERPPGERRDGEVGRDGEGRRAVEPRKEEARREGEGRRAVEPRKEEARRDGEPRRVAEPGRDGEPRRAPEPDREPVGRGEARGEVPRPSPFGADLNDEQRRAVMGVMQSTRVEMQELTEKNRHARMALEEAVLAEKPDPKVVEHHVREIGETEARLAATRAGALARIRPHLLAEQFERLRYSPMFGGLGPMGPGGPPPGGRGLPEGEGRFGNPRGPQPEGREELRRPAPDRERRDGDGRPPAVRGEGEGRPPAPRGEGDRRPPAPREGELRDRPPGEREAPARREEAPPRRDGDREPERRSPR